MASQKFGLTTCLIGFGLTAASAALASMFGPAAERQHVLAVSVSTPVQDDGMDVAFQNSVLQILQTSLPEVSAPMESFNTEGNPDSIIARARVQARSENIIPTLLGTLMDLSQIQDVYDRVPTEFKTSDWIYNNLDVAVENDRIDFFEWVYTKDGHHLNIHQRQQLLNDVTSKGYIDLARRFLEDSRRLLPPNSHFSAFSPPADLDVLMP